MPGQRLDVRRRGDAPSRYHSWCFPSLSQIARSFVLAVVVLWAAPALATSVCFFPVMPNGSTAQDYATTPCATEIVWPTTWTPKTSATEPAADVTSLISAYDLVGNSAYPSVYVAKMYVPARAEYFLFLRTRVNVGTVAATGATYVGGTQGTIFFLFTNTSPSSSVLPKWAVGLDLKQANPATHGMEFLYPMTGGSQTTTWTSQWWDDLDGTQSSKCFYDIDGSDNYSNPCPWRSDRHEGYARTVDGQPFTSGTTTHWDFAIACSYFTRVAGSPNLGGFNPCTQPFWTTAVTVNSSNDAAKWLASADLDINAVGNVESGSNNTITTGNWSGEINPTSVVVASLEARNTRHGVEVSWNTASEVGTAGFNLHRRDPVSGNPVQVNRVLVPASYGSPNGGRYRILDPGASPSGESVYVLEEVEFQGTHREYGPFTVLPRKGQGGASEPGRWASGEALREVRIDDPGTARLRGPRKATPSAGRRHEATRGRGGGARVVVARDGLQVLRASDLAGALGIAEPAARNLIRNGMLRIKGPDGDVACQSSASGERLYFVGRTLDTTWSSTATYLLTSGRCRSFEIASAAPPRGGAPSLPTAFTDRIHVEQDVGPALSLFDAPDEDFWLWQYLLAGDSTMGATTFDLPATHATGGPGEVTLFLQGTTSTGTIDEHHVRVSIGGSVIGESRWTGKAPVAAAFTLPAGRLRPDGGNTLLVEAVLDSNVRYSGFAVDSLDVAWERRAVAAGDRLSLPAGLAGEIVADGFTGGDIWALDLTHPKHPVLLGGVSATQRNGGWMVRFARRDGAGPVLLTRPGAAFEPALTPVASRPGLEMLAGRGADTLIITSPDLEIAAGRLTEIHGARGLRAEVVTTDRIYDRYSKGNLDPLAIRTFLGEVHRNWHRRPTYVVLVGSGTWDGRNILGLGDNHVPPMLVDTPYGLAVSDVALADVEGEDGVPEFAIGRIPASTEADLHGYLDKLEDFGKATGPWARRALFLSDNADPGGDFPTDSRASMRRLEGRMDLTEASLAGDPAATRASTLAALGDGLGVLHYFGHAAGDRLAAESLLGSADVDLLLNGGRAPFALLMTCSAGSFGFPGYDSLGVRLTLHPAGGAIATLGPSSLELQADSRLLSQEILSRLGPPSPPSFGEVVRQAMAASRDAGSPLSTRLTYNLFGDPSVALAP